MSSAQNPLGLKGLSFIEFVSPQPENLARLFLNFGFSRTHIHDTQNIELYRQNEIVFLLHRSSEGQSGHFMQHHGPGIASMGWKFADPLEAAGRSVERGAVARFTESGFRQSAQTVPAISGIGDSLIYFTPEKIDWQQWGFRYVAAESSGKGFLSIDHLTNNVEFGTLKKWADFYKNVFGFTEVRYFDIRGLQTGLQSYALRSPCGTFCIPINEAQESHSQINECLREYRGPGIQHLAFLTQNILASLEAMRNSGIETLDIDDDYYSEALARVPQVTEDIEALKRHKILIDGDKEGYLLQIFTKNVVGPIFIEMIQRKNHQSFGEGNFAALFRSIERDQEKRGVLG